MSILKDNSKLLISSVGIFICYFYFGIMQEKITRGRYGKEVNEDGTVGERFTFTLALVAVQCLFNWIFAKGARKHLNHVIFENLLKSKLQLKLIFLLLCSNPYRESTGK